MITPDHILAVAANLVASPTATEADYRSAISRAYYAIFHHVIKRLNVDMDKGSGPIHQRAENELLSQPVICPEDIRLAKRVFRSLKADRVRADYDLTEHVTCHNAEMAVERARRVLTASQ